MTSAASIPPLPRGQRLRDDFPRFGLTPFARRFPRQPTRTAIDIAGDALEPATLDAPLDGLERVEQTSDFHCVTTWSCRALRWSGVRFADFYALRLAGRARPGANAVTVVMRAQDGYRTTLPLADLLARDVLLADTLDGCPLSIEHGAPLRIVAPAHYGYKSVKHLARLELWQGAPTVRPPAFAFMDHPRARVAFEERGRGVPGWLLRYVYRPLVRRTAATFERAMHAHTAR
jgi:DMSO/TMAO reductase YedYZ molybdopterin-dependent catalytic subunit